MTATGIGPVYDCIGHLVMTPEDLIPVLALPLFTELAALSTLIALIVLCVEVDENPATRNHLWILAGMILVSFGTEFVYRRVTGQKYICYRKRLKETPTRRRSYFWCAFRHWD